MAQKANERFLVWGAGGHGKVVSDLVRACGCQVVGCVDADPATRGRLVEPGGARVVLLQDELLHCLDNERDLPGADALALAVGSNPVRLELAIRARGVRIPHLVHPSAIVSPSARVGLATVVLPAAVINADAEIGTAVIINTGAVIEHDCYIGDGAHVSPGAVLAGGVRVGERSWIGTGAVVIPEIRIGAGVMVGAGTVVIRDVPDGQTIVGNPARQVDARS